MCTDNNNQLDDFVTSIVDNGIGDIMEEEPIRMEASKQLLFYGASNGQFQLLPIKLLFLPLHLHPLLQHGTAEMLQYLKSNDVGTH